MTHTSHSKLLVTLLGLAVSLCAGGCFTPVMTNMPEDSLVERGNYHLVEKLDVPPVRGVQGCGAQALATVLSHLDVSYEPVALADELPWHEVGATPVDLLVAARQYGQSARIQRGTFEDLDAYIQAGAPVLVMIDVEIEVPTLLGRIPTVRLMHWAVVSGVARDGERVLLAAPRGWHHVAERDDFLRRWERGGNCLIVVGET